MKNILLVFIIMLVFTGCFSQITPEQRIASSSYPELTRHILDANLSNISRIEDERIVFEEYMSGKFGSVSHTLNEARNEYLRRYDSSRDAIANAFIANAKTQKHIVRMYKANVNAALTHNLPLTWELKNHEYSNNLDNAFIEFDENDRIIAVLARAHWHGTTIGVNDYLVSIIAFGSNARYVESHISNNTLQNGFIAEFR
ncbi:hypothetical protein [Campylobacter majalis]|uniref:hypothetical protein n=1 Tax=Campylobacter majalis TaxID=2790656 RepID=UPI003D68C96F